MLIINQLPIRLREGNYKFFMKNLTINRVPESTNNSLKAYSAADELLIYYLEEKNPESVIIYNDSFGYLAAHSAPRTIYLASDLKSQEKAAIENFEINKLDSNCLLPTSLLKKADFASTLIIYDGLEGNEALVKSAKNLKNVKTLDVKGINVYDILNFDQVIVTDEIFKNNILGAIA